MCSKKGGTSVRSRRNHDGLLRDWETLGNAYPAPALSLTRMSPALTPSTPASATPGSTPWRTRAFDQLVWPGGKPLASTAIADELCLSRIGSPRGTICAAQRACRKTQRPGAFAPSAGCHCHRLARPAVSRMSPLPNSAVVVASRSGRSPLRRPLSCPHPLALMAPNAGSFR